MLFDDARDAFESGAAFPIEHLRVVVADEREGRAMGRGRGVAALTFQGKYGLNAAPRGGCLDVGASIYLRAFIYLRTCIDGNAWACDACSIERRRTAARDGEDREPG